VKVETWPLERLLPYDRNPRKNDHAVEQVARAIERFGFRVPIVARSSGEVIDGHLRLKAARHLGLAEVPVVLADDMTEEQVRAFRLSVNRMAELAEWDSDLLAVEIADLAELGVDIEAIGFDAPALAEIGIDVGGSSRAEVVEGETPEPPADPITKPGDLWLLGDHRLLCGDSTKAEDVERLMAGEKADMVFTDPPYGVNIQGSKNGRATLIAGDLTQTAIPFSFDLAVTLATASDARLYFCGGEGNLYLYQKLFEKHCRQLPRHLIWIKNGFTMKPNGYHNQYEIIFHGYKPGGGSLEKWFGERTEDAASDCWKISRDASSLYEHPTQKPVALPTRAIANSSPKGGLVYEPFGGSGSTFLAAEQLGRKCYGMEIDPTYCDVIVRRWETLTGKTAVRE